MVEFAAGVLQTGFNIRQFQVGQFFQHLLRGEPVREEVQNIGHANPQAANTRASFTLLRIDRDALHARKLG